MRNATLALFVAGLLVPQVCCFAQGSKPQSQPAANPMSNGDPSAYLNRDWDKTYALERTGDRLLGNVTVPNNALIWTRSR